MTPETSTAPNDSSQATAPGEADLDPARSAQPSDAAADPELPEPLQRRPGEAFAVWGERLRSYDAPRQPAPQFVRVWTPAEARAALLELEARLPGWKIG